MALVNVTNIALLNNPSTFDSDFEFEISYHLMAPLQQYLEWRLVYVGSADSSEYDQVLDTVDVGPSSVGESKFVFVAPPPNAGKIPSNDIIGVTILMLYASYRGADFLKVGYYVNNEMVDGKDYKGNPTDIKRHVLVSNPKSTRFDIRWD